MVFIDRDPLNKLSNLTGATVWCVKMPAGLAGPLRFHAVLDRDQLYFLIFFIIPTPSAEYDHAAGPVNAIKAAQD